MLKVFLPDKYEMLNGKSLFIKDPDTKFGHDEFYKRSINQQSYEEFLKEIFQLAKPAQRKFFESVGPFILKYTFCVRSDLDSPRYYLTKNRIVITLPDSKLDKITQVLGAPFFFSAVTMNYNIRQLYIPHIARELAFLLTKIAMRPIPFEEVTDLLIQTIVGWLCKKYNVLNKLSEYATKAGVGFVSPTEKRNVETLVTNMKNVDDFFKFLEDQLSSSTIKQMFITRYGIDIALTFDDPVHLLYNTATALYTNYPAILKQYLVTSPVKENANKLADSLGSRLIRLPS